MKGATSAGLLGASVTSRGMLLHVRHAAHQGSHTCLVLHQGPQNTWYPTCHPHSQDALGAHLQLPLLSCALIFLISLISSEVLITGGAKCLENLRILLANLF